MGHSERAARFHEVLIRGGVAEAGDIAGCSPAEIAALEDRYGTFPDSYRAVLGLMGRGAGKFIRHKEFSIFADDLDAVNRAGWECVADYAEDGVVLEVPADAVFICARYGADHPHFLRAGRAEDSPVWAINADVGTVSRPCASVWDWIEGFLVDHPRARALLEASR